MNLPIYPMRIWPSCTGLVAAGVAAFVLAVVRPSQSLAGDVLPRHHAPADMTSPAPEKVNTVPAKAEAETCTGLLRLSEDSSN